VKGDTCNNLSQILPFCNFLKESKTYIVIMVVVVPDVFFFTVFFIFIFLKYVNITSSLPATKVVSLELKLC